MRKIGQVCDKRSQARCYWLDLKDNLFRCPCCDRMPEVAEAKRHHSVAHADGGLSERWNVIAICASCHVTIHAGTNKDSYELNMRARNALLAKFGLLHWIQEGWARDLVRSMKPIGLAEYRRLDRILKNGSTKDNAVMPFEDARSLPKGFGNDIMPSIWSMGRNP